MRGSIQSNRSRCIVVSANEGVLNPLTFFPLLGDNCTRLKIYNHEVMALASAGFFKVSSAFLRTTLRNHFPSVVFLFLNLLLFMELIVVSFHHRIGLQKEIRHSRRLTSPIDIESGLSHSVDLTHP